MTYKFNVNKYTIEEDGKFVAYVNVIDAQRIVRLLNEKDLRIRLLEKKYTELKEVYVE